MIVAMQFNAAIVLGMYWESIMKFRNVTLPLALVVFLSGQAHAGFLDDLKKGVESLGDTIEKTVGGEPAEGAGSEGQNSKPPSSAPPVVRSAPPENSGGYVNLNKDRAAVRDAQSMLNMLSIDAGIPDGLYGGKTRRAIRAFEGVRGLPVTGDVTPNLIISLRNAVKSAGGTPATSASNYATRANASANSQAARRSQDTSADVKDAQTRDRVYGGAGGAVAGGTIGAIFGGKKGALIGAGVGTVVGLGVGNEMANRRGDYAKEYAQIDAAIGETDQKIVALNSQTSRIERQIFIRDAEIRKLQADTLTTKQSATYRQALLTQIEADIAKNIRLKEDSEVEKKVLEDEIASVDALLKEAPSDKGLIERRDKLVGRRGELLASLRRLNGIEPQLNAQQKLVKSRSSG